MTATRPVSTTTSQPTGRGWPGRRGQRTLGPRRPRRMAHLSDGARLSLLGVLALTAVIGYLTLNAKGHWDFVLPFRGRTLVALILVAMAIATSAVVFQTITENRILTPQIMGFDSLYELIQTGLVFILGSTAVNALAGMPRFGIEVALMLVLSLALFWWLFGGHRRDVVLLVLVGIVFGTFFRSVSTFLQRIIDPNESLIVTDRLFASFTAVNEQILPLAVLLIIASSIGVWSLRRRLDVVALGPSLAVAMGLNHRRTVLILLSLSAVQVAVSTALVGPVLFFGLIASNVAYHLVRSAKHAVVLPTAALVAIILLIGAQAILQHLLGLGTVLSVIIEFTGGLLFIGLLLKGQRR